MEEHPYEKYHFDSDELDTMLLNRHYILIPPPPHFPNTLLSFLSFINFLFAMNAFASLTTRMFFTTASRCGWHFLVALIYKIEKVFGI